METHWYIEMLGGLRATCGNIEVTRFSTKKVGLLLAYLAYYPQVPHTRQHLAEMLWPEEVLDVSAPRLRQAFSSLRRQMEPPGLLPAPLLQTSGGRSILQINKDLILTDVSLFHQALRRTRENLDVETALPCLIDAVNLYRGEFLPGYEEEWVLLERERIVELALSAIQRLIAIFTQQNDLERACEMSQRALQLDPLNEQSHLTLIRLLLSAQKPSQALRQYQVLETIWREQLDSAPSTSARKLAQQIRQILDNEVVHPPKAAPDFPSASPIPTPAPPGNPPPTLPRMPAPPLVKHLPSRFTRFFGRTEEIAMLKSILLSTENAPRFITLLGSGGCGKTRLALEVADLLSSQHSISVCYVPLAEITDPELLPSTLAQSLQLALVPEEPPFTALERQWKEWPILLVLDNMEQLLSQANKASRCHDLLYDMLDKLPLAKCLATSRQPIGLEGEQRFIVGPLPTPKITFETLTPQELIAYPSVQLLLDRAQSFKPDFQITTRTAHTIASIVKQLEGIPLALELAATWCNYLSLNQIMQRMEHPLEFLVSRNRPLSTRHMGLYPALKWSFDLLTPSQQQLFARLAVFRGGFTSKACQHILQLQHPEEALNELAERSLLSLSQLAQEPRYTLLEIVRKFALSYLSAEELAALSRSHANYFLSYVREQTALLLGPERPRAQQLLDQEKDNIRAALEWAFQNDPSLAQTLAATTWYYWSLANNFTEGRYWLEQALQKATPDASPDHVARVLLGLGLFAKLQGDYAEAMETFNKGLALAHSHNILRAQAEFHGQIGTLAYEQGHLEMAQKEYALSLALWQKLDNPRLVATTLNNMALIAQELGSFEEAAQLLQDSLQTKRSSGDQQGVIDSLNNLALVEYERENHETALLLFEEALEKTRALQNPYVEAILLNNLTSVLLALGLPERARSYQAKSLRIRCELNDMRGIAYSFESCAWLAIFWKKAELAAKLLGAAQALRQEIGAPRLPSDERRIKKIELQILSHISQEQFKGFYISGQALRWQEALPLVETILGSLGQLSTHQPDSLC